MVTVAEPANRTAEKHKINTTDPRVRRTRKLIYESFAGLLAEKDFQSITVQDIAERAAINRATFYAHFEDKYDLLADSVRDALSEMLRQRQPESQTFTLVNLRLLAGTVYEFMSQFNDHCRIRLHKNESMFIAAQVQQHVYETLLGWLKNTEVLTRSQPTASLELAAMTASWVILGATVETGQSDQHHDADSLADQMISLLAKGLDAYLIASA